MYTYGMYKGLMRGVGEGNPSPPPPNMRNEGYGNPCSGSKDSRLNADDNFGVHILQQQQKGSTIISSSKSFTNKTKLNELARKHVRNRLCNRQNKK